ncbi:hypothetical protein NDU88_004194 [Pleurodeles waltl]|uniref:Uncharacterized protein n=1 Tax=Pleurodeles waltl TaxID=8319 RepID=A0AAV7VJJ6_PLEWA|nr:hypothetical protein NDU88_004194 [Pleurodeles waltl]
MPTTRWPRARPARPQDPSPGPSAAEEDHQNTESRGPSPPKSPQPRGPSTATYNPGTATAADPTGANAGQASPLQAARPSSHQPQGRGGHRGTAAAARLDRRLASLTAPPSISARPPAKAERAHNTAGPTPAESSSTSPIARASGSQIFRTGRCTVSDSKSPGRGSAISAAPSG